MGRKESNQTKKKHTHTFLSVAKLSVVLSVTHAVQNNIHFRNTYENLEYLPNKIPISSVSGCVVFCALWHLASAWHAVLQPPVDRL